MNKVPGVPNTGEYEQLIDLSEIAYWEEREQFIDPLMDDALKFNGEGNTAAACHLWLWADALTAQAYEARWRREDIIRWLYLDTQLRASGKTYPDVYEARPKSVSHPDDEF